MRGAEGTNNEVRRMGAVVLGSMLPFISPITESRTEEILGSTRKCGRLIVSFQKVRFVKHNFTSRIFHIFRRRRPRVGVAPLRTDASVLTVVHRLKKGRRWVVFASSLWAIAVEDQNVYL